jgi:hypothetical protein
MYSGDLRKPRVRRLWLYMAVHGACSWRLTVQLVLKAVVSNTPSTRYGRPTLSCHCNMLDAKAGGCWFCFRINFCNKTGNAIERSLQAGQ